MANQHENDGSSQQPGPTSQAPTSDAIKAQNSLKARKRTKTGCLSKSAGYALWYGNPNIILITLQHVASEGSSAARRDRLVPIVSSQKEVARVMLLASHLRIR